jgi:DNA-binding NtrC family response regulator
VRPSVLLLSQTAVALRPDLEAAGWDVSSLELEAVARLDICPGVVVFDPEATGLLLAEVLREVRRTFPTVPVLVLGDSKLTSAIDALREGASDYVERSSASTEIIASLRRLMEQRAIAECLSTRQPSSLQFPELVGESSGVSALRARIRQAAGSDVTVLTVGETGTGKELVARLVHAASERSHGPFVVVNCAAIPDSLADSELFGHVKGAFTGASAQHRGLFRAAHGGTLYLDDVGALSPDVQAKLLRALQQKSVRPVGGSGELPVDFRVIASSTVELDALVREGSFREDLYYRLAVLEIPVPPLRERGLDVMLLAEAFLEEASIRSGKEIRGITPAVARAFLSYAWPGNVRELKNAIDYAVAVARYDHLTESDLPEVMRPRANDAGVPADEDVRWETVERRHIEAVLRSVQGNRAHAARLLGIDRKTLHRKLERMNIEVPPRTRSGSRIVSPASSAALREGEGEAVQSTRYRFIFR